MAQIFIFGASTAYGSGADQAGWGDLLKQSLLAEMYGKDGVGERYELYNFAQHGATIEFVLVTAPQMLKYYRKSGKVIAVVQVGGNNIKAEGTPDGFVVSLEEYEQLMSQLIDKLKDDVDELVVLDALMPVDETQTNPEIDKTTGHKSYFTNDRIILFNHVLAKLCRKQGVHHVDLTTDPKEWVKERVSADGLHPNQAGHRFIFDKLLPQLEEILKN